MPLPIWLLISGHRQQRSGEFLYLIVQRNVPKILLLQVFPSKLGKSSEMLT